MSKKFSGIALATTAALLFSAAPLMSAQADEAKVKCDGGNSCAKQSACKTSSSSCAAKNNCKGLGFTMEASKAACDAAKDKNKKSS